MIYFIDWIFCQFSLVVNTKIPEIDMIMMHKKSPTQAKELHIIMTEIQGDLIQTLLDSRLISRRNLRSWRKSVVFEGKVLDFDVLREFNKKFAFFRAKIDENAKLQEQSPTYRQVFEKDLANLSEGKKALMVAEWEYKILIKSIADWIKDQRQKGTQEIILYAQKTNMKSIQNFTRQVSLIGKDDFHINQDFIGTVADISQKLPNRGHGGLGTFGVKPITTKKDLDVHIGGQRFFGGRRSSIKNRLLEYLTKPRKAKRGMRSVYWVKNELVAPQYTAKIELGVVDELTRMLKNADNYSAVKVPVGRIAVSRQDRTVDNFFKKYESGLIRLKLSFGEDLHEDINFGVSEGNLAEYISCSKGSEIQSFRKLKSAAKKRLNNLQETIDDDSLIHLKPNEIKDLKKQLGAIKKHAENVTNGSKVVTWTDEQSLAVVFHYLMKRRMKKLVNNNNKIAQEVAEVICNPSKYTLMRSLGIGEIYGPRKLGKESRWIIDHIAVYRITEDSNDIDRYVALWMGDKKWDMMYRSNGTIMAKDLRNQYNLMLNRFVDEDGVSLIFSESGKRIIDFLHGLSGKRKPKLTGEKKAFSKLLELHATNRIIKQFGLYSMYDVIETTLDGDVKVQDAIADVQVFQIQSDQ
ncbi:MAG: hypothetical protein ACE5OZ_18655 [Candidatus Heimdallarchaeota archaeon]